MDSATLQAAVGCDASHGDTYAPFMTEAMQKFGISTPARQAMFLAQVGHESGSLQYATELWGPTPAQLRYEGSKTLGNTEPGDGFKFRGRGLIQITGRANYQACNGSLGTPQIDFVVNPELLAQPYYACMSAAWFWASHGLNEVADTGDFEKVTKIINGGLNGQADRLARLAQAQNALQGT